jgi:uncharacterized protein YkwD
MSRTTRGLGAMRPEQANRDQPEAQQGGSGCGCFLTILVIVGAVIGVSFAAERYDFPGADLFRTTNSKAEQWYWQVGQFLFDNEAEPTLADGSVTTPTPPPPTAAPIVIRATATPAPTLTRSGPVSSVSTAPVQTSAARLPYTPVPAPTYTSRPTVTPWPSRTPTPWLTPTPAWRPPTPQELAELKQLMLELTNTERAKHGAPPVKLGDNPSPQTHAEHGLKNCYSSHWDQWGLKPLYRYALTGGDQYAAENGSGIDYCPKASDNYRINHSSLWEDEVRKTVRGWIGSPGHLRNLIDPRHTMLHAGIEMGKYSTNMVQVFSGDYVSWTERPNIQDATLTAAGQLGNAFWDKNGNYGLTSIAYHPPVHELTPGQLAGTYCLESDIQVGSLSRPLEPGWYYTDPETGRQYTDYAIYTRENSQCVDPYELPADRPSPASWDTASAQHRAAIELSSSMADEESTAYKIVSKRLGINSDGRTFSIRANLSPILSHYGPGIYTVTIWATTPDGKPNPVAQYPIWWHTEPTPGHPY